MTKEQLHVRNNLVLWRVSCACGFRFIGVMSSVCPWCHEIAGGMTHFDELGLIPDDGKDFVPVPIEAWTHELPEGYFD